MQVTANILEPLATDVKWKRLRTDMCLG